MSSRRTLAQATEGGLTTLNLTDSLKMPRLKEMPLVEIERNKRSANAMWHQTTPALKLVLCKRADMDHRTNFHHMVFFAAVQRKQMSY
jgi:hypothetical protein